MSKLWFYISFSPTSFSILIKLFHVLFIRNKRRVLHRFLLKYPDILYSMKFIFSIRWNSSGFRLTVFNFKLLFLLPGFSIIDFSPLSTTKFIHLTFSFLLLSPVDKLKIFHFVLLAFSILLYFHLVFPSFFNFYYSNLDYFTLSLHHTFRYNYLPIYYYFCIFFLFKMSFPQNNNCSFSFTFSFSQFFFFLSLLQNPFSPWILFLFFFLRTVPANSYFARLRYPDFISLGI